MNEVYRINRKKMIIYFVIFIAVSSMITYWSIENTLKYSKALDNYDDSVKNGSNYFDATNLLERMNYERDSERYSLRLIMTIAICGIELLILYMYFLKNNKMIIDTEGIKLYRLYERKATKIYNWDMISSVKFQYADGIRGLTSGYGMKIYFQKGSGYDPEVFIPVERFLNFNDIPDMLSEKCPNIQIEVPQRIETDSKPIIELLKEAYLEYKNDFSSYMIYSFIIFIFASMNAIFNNQPVNLITSIANIYFGYRAKIAMNYKAYMSYKGEKIDFDRAWNHAKGRIGRFFGAEFIIGIVSIIFIGIGALIFFSGIERNIKIIIFIVLGIGCILSVSRLYLISYIASIVNTNESFMSLNGTLIKKYYKEIILIVSLLSIRVILMLGIVIMYYTDIYTMKDLFVKVTLVNVVLDLLVSPYTSTLIMNLLRELPMSSGVSQNE